VSRSISSLLVATLAACGSGEAFQPLPFELPHGASVRITVASGPYAAGALVPLTVSNLGDQEYVWNPCMHALQRPGDPEWTTVDEPERVYTALGWILRPGGRTETTTDLPASVPAGEYRFRFGLSRPAGDHNVTEYQVSNSFTVTP
jgi:hypothetical protein